MESVFNLILAVMTAFDTIFLMTSVAEFSIVETFHLTSYYFDTAFVYFLYPIHNITLTCSIFLHVVLAFERYLAVCHPELVYSNQRRAVNHSQRQPRHSVNGRSNDRGGDRFRNNHRRTTSNPIILKKVSVTLGAPFLVSLFSL